MTGVTLHAWTLNTVSIGEIEHLSKEAEQHNNNHDKEKEKYDKEKYKEMILDAAETVLGFFLWI